MDALDGYLSQRLSEAADRDRAFYESRLPALRTDALTRIKKRRGRFQRVAIVAVAAIAVAAAITVPRLLDRSAGHGFGVTGVGASRITNFDIPGRIVFGDGRLWVDNADNYDHNPYNEDTKNLEGFTSIDPASNAVHDWPPVTKDADSLIFVNGDIWASGSVSQSADAARANQLPSAGYLEQVDTHTMTLVRTHNLSGVPYGVAFAGPTTSAASGSKGSIWVANIGGSEVWRLDVATGELTSIDVGRETWDVTAAGGLIWFLGKTGGLISVDPATNQVTTTRELCGSREIFALGALWVSGCDGYLLRLDPQSGTLTNKIEVDDGRVLEGIAELDGHLWVSEVWTDKVVEVDPDSGRVVSRVSVGDKPFDVVSGGGALWLDHAQSDIVTRVDP
ncbi:MAG: hypothetical protein ABR579_03395 [Actinomycetota bacterium]